MYLKEGTYHTRLFRGPSTNGMKKWDGPSHSWTYTSGGGRSVGLVGHGDISGLHDNRLSDTDSGIFILIIG